MNLLTLTIIGVILGIVFKRNKAVSVYLMLLCWLLIGWAYGHADYYNYSHFFYSISASFKWQYMNEPLFYGMMYLIKTLGGTYLTVTILMGLLGVILFSIAIIRSRAPFNFVMSLTVLSCYLLYIVQIRNFVAMAFLMLAIPYLTTEKRNIVWYCILVALASGFHISFLFYYLFLGLVLLNRKWMIGISAVLLIVAFALRPYYQIYEKAIFGMEYQLSNSSSVDRGTFIYIAYVLICILLIIVEQYLLSKGKIENKLSSFQSAMLELCYKINVFMIVMVPLLMASIETIRLYRNILPFNFMVIGYLSYENENKMIIKVRPACVAMITASIIYALAFGDLFVYRQCYNTVFLPVFNKNLLWVNY